ncbi:MAG: hypothetical protein EBQ82_07530 [Betaproteobacteria bacterium]|nr:hypothetical protein [Betaproteobacteria bacterium]NBY05224.1 hypothetical protein [Betaproteobacteria bacterium]
MLIALALALLQIVTGLVAYHQSTQLLRETKFSTAANLANGLVTAIADLVVLKDYAAIESRLLQTMANQEVIDAALINSEGKIVSELRRTPDKIKVVFNGPVQSISDLMRGQALLQKVEEPHIITWAKISVGTDLGWIKLTTLVALDQDELTSLQRQTFWLSMGALLSGALILGLFLWRAYFSVVKRGHVIENQLDDVSTRLHQSEKLASLGQLAAGVAHEINNPIGYVSSNLTTLNKYIVIYEKTIDQLLAQEAQTRQPPPADAADAPTSKPKPVASLAIRQDVQELLRETQEGITRVKNIIQDLKDFSRSNAGQHFILADLQLGLRSTINIVASEVKYRAELELQLATLPQVECVPSQINQVFLNMIVNAAQAMPKDHKGKIIIRSGESNGMVWFEFEDNGIGMDASTIDRIFDPFFTTKDIGTGTGLGLSVSLGIVKRHGGQILVHSTLGVGTTFKIELPVSQPHHETSLPVVNA